MNTTDAAGRAGTDAAIRREPRALRTRQRVIDAFLGLLDERPYADISVAELCRSAGVHRVTFYGHWADLDALSGDVFGELIDAIATVPPRPDDADLTPGQLAAEYSAALRRILLEVSARRDAYRALLTAPAGAVPGRLMDVIRRRSEIAVTRMAQHGIPVADAGGYAAAYIAGGVVASLRTWAESEGGEVDDAVEAIVAQMPNWWPAPEA